LNDIQSQTFTKLFKSRDSVLVGASGACEKHVCAELAILRELKKENAKIVYVSPVQSQCDMRLKRWKELFGEKLGV